MLGAVCLKSFRVSDKGLRLVVQVGGASYSVKMIGASGGNGVVSIIAAAGMNEDAVIALGVV